MIRSLCHYAEQVFHAQAGVSATFFIVSGFCVTPRSILAIVADRRRL
jgi:hypothetical protein